MSPLFFLLLGFVVSLSWGVIDLTNHIQIHAREEPNSEPHIHAESLRWSNSTSKEILLHQNWSYSFPKPNDIARFKLLNGRIVQGNVEAVTATGDAGYVISGSTSDGWTFYLSHFQGAIAAEVTAPDGEAHYQLRPHDLSKAIYSLQMFPRPPYDRTYSSNVSVDLELDSHTDARGQKEPTRPEGQLQSPIVGPVARVDSLAVKDTNNILDVMFIFTPQAYARVGGTNAAMNALAALSVEMANDAYINTQVPLRMRSVSVKQSDYRNYVEVSFERDLIRLRYDYDNYFDTDVHQGRRAALGADVVVLFVASAATCGLSYPWATADLAFAVISVQCPDSVVHEIGHSIGLNHDRVTDQNFDLSQYGFGYCWDTGPTSCRRSIMAAPGCVTKGRRSNCPRGAYFSSPLIVNGQLGSTTGLTTADNARVLREQASRAVNWARSTTKSGIIRTVEPAAVPLGRCEPITISGWGLSSSIVDSADDPVVSVTLAGIAAQRVVAQTPHSVHVLAGPADNPFTGDVVVTTRSGYQTILRGAFQYQDPSGNFTTDFDTVTLGSDNLSGTPQSPIPRPAASTLGVTWNSVGAVEWETVRYCDALPCNSTQFRGPLVGHGGSGYFATLHAYEATPDTGILETRFNTNPRGCNDSVHSVSLYYHLYTEEAECAAVVSLQAQDGDGRWSTVATSTQRQSQQTDPWLPLRYTFPNPENVYGIRIVGVPYSSGGICFHWASASVDSITVEKATVCAVDGCDYISPWPSTAPTAVPTANPTTLSPTPRPTFTPSPTSVPTYRPTYLLRPAIEYVRFGCSQRLNGISAGQFRASATGASSFLSTVASQMQVSVQSLCCLQVTDAALPDDTPAARRILSTANATVVPAAVDVAYNVELVVHRVIAVGAPSTPGLSSDATAAFQEATQRLQTSVSSGAFQTALSSALPPELAGATAAALQTGSIGAPTSMVITLTSSPTMQPTIRTRPGDSDSLVEWTAATCVVLAVILIAAGGAAYGLWKFGFCSALAAPFMKLMVDEEEQKGGPSTRSMAALLDDGAAPAATGDDGTGGGGSPGMELGAEGEAFSEGGDVDQPPEPALPPAPQPPSVRPLSYSLVQNNSPRAEIPLVPCGAVSGLPPRTRSAVERGDWWVPVADLDDLCDDLGPAPEETSRAWEASLASLAYYGSTDESDGAGVTSTAVERTSYRLLQRHTTPRNFVPDPASLPRPLQAGHPTPSLHRWASSRDGIATGTSDIVPLAPAPAPAPASRPHSQRNLEPPLACASSDCYRPQAPQRQANSQRNFAPPLASVSADVKDNAAPCALPIMPSRAPPANGSSVATSPPLVVATKRGLQSNFPHLAGATLQVNTQLQNAYPSSSGSGQTSPRNSGRLYVANSGSTDRTERLSGSLHPTPRYFVHSNMPPRPQSGRLSNLAPSGPYAPSASTDAGEGYLASRGALASASVDMSVRTADSGLAGRAGRPSDSPRNFYASMHDTPRSASLSRSYSTDLHARINPDVGLVPEYQQQKQQQGLTVVVAQRRSERGLRPPMDAGKGGMVRPGTHVGASPSSVAAATPTAAAVAGSGLSQVQRRVNDIEESLSGKRSDAGAGASIERSLSRSASSGTPRHCQDLSRIHSYEL